jgi:hypothetical protein
MPSEPTGPISFQKRCGWRGRRRCCDRGANLFGNLGQVADEVVDGLCGQLGVVGERGIEVVDVGLVVLVVVNLHRLGVDERFEGGVVVRKRCEFVSHRGNLLRLEFVLSWMRGMAGFCSVRVKSWLHAVPA